MLYSFLIKKSLSKLKKMLENLESLNDMITLILGYYEIGKFKSEKV
jgi:hypothetical protein